jgi:hypothetical protein
MGELKVTQSQESSASGVIPSREGCGPRVCVRDVRGFRL